MQAPTGGGNPKRRRKNPPEPEPPQLPERPSTPPQNGESSQPTEQRAHQLSFTVPDDSAVVGDHTGMPDAKQSGGAFVEMRVDDNGTDLLPTGKATRFEFHEPFGDMPDGPPTTTPDDGNPESASATPPVPTAAAAPAVQATDRIPAPDGSAPPGSDAWSAGTTTNTAASSFAGEEYGISKLPEPEHVSPRGPRQHSTTPWSGHPGGAAAENKPESGRRTPWHSMEPRPGLVGHDPGPHVDLNAAPAVAAGIALERARRGKRDFPVILPDIHLAFHHNPENSQPWDGGDQAAPHPAQDETRTAANGPVKDEPAASAPAAPGPRHAAAGEDVRFARIKQAILVECMTGSAAVALALGRAVAARPDEDWRQALDALTPEERRALTRPGPAARQLHHDAIGKVLSALSSSEPTVAVPDPTDIPDLHPIEGYRYFGGKTGRALTYPEAAAIIDVALRRLPAALETDSVTVDVGPFLVHIVKFDDVENSRASMENRVLEMLALRGAEGITRLYYVGHTFAMPGGGHAMVSIRSGMPQAVQIADGTAPPEHLVATGVRHIHTQLGGTPAENLDPRMYLRELVAAETRRVNRLFQDFGDLLTALEVPVDPFAPVRDRLPFLDPARFRVLLCEPRFGHLLIAMVDGRLVVFDREFARRESQHHDRPGLIDEPDPPGSYVYGGDALTLLLQIQRITHGAEQLIQAADAGTLTPEQVVFTRTALLRAFATARSAWQQQTALPPVPVTTAIGVWHGLGTDMDPKLLRTLDDRTLLANLAAGFPARATLAEAFRSAIGSGSLAAHQQLPSAAQLAEHFGISPATAGFVYAKLRREGLVVTRQGSGTVVAEKLLTSEPTEDMPNSGYAVRGVVDSMNLAEMLPGRSNVAALADGLRTAIHAGDLPVGWKLPGVKELATDLGVSGSTVARAYRQLAGQGHLAVFHGAGTVVTNQKPAANQSPAPQPAQSPAPQQAPPDGGAVDMPVDLERADITTLQQAMASGEITSEQLTLAYLRRIRAFSLNGPRLNAVQEVNPDALDDAARLDAERREGRVRGPLHGIPVLIKDLLHMKGTPTTAGALALRESFPDDDAFVVKRLRDAGAVLLGKTKLTELAGFITTDIPNGYSALGGQVLHPYNPALDPLGSSTGSAVAAAAGLATVTVGTETFGSTISPAASNSLVGVKTTVGLVSRTGMLPIASTQDTVGPIARSVRDAAVLLNVLAGPDPEDPITATGARVFGTDYTAALATDALRGKRIGIVAAEGAGTLHTDFAEAQAVITAQGATLVPVAITDPTLPSVIVREYKRDLDRYFGRLPADATITSLDGLIRFNLAHAAEGSIDYGQSRLISANEVDLDDPVARMWYEADRAARISATRLRIDSPLEANDLDALLFIHNDSHLVGPCAQYPCVTVPIGYDTNTGQPHGMTFVGTAFSEASLLALGYAYEQAAAVWRPPSAMNPALRYGPVPAAPETAHSPATRTTADTAAPSSAPPPRRPSAVAPGPMGFADPDVPFDGPHRPWHPVRRQARELGIDHIDGGGFGHGTGQGRKPVAGQREPGEPEDLAQQPNARETAVLNLVYQGLTPAEIADRLGTSSGSVKNHQSRAAAKFGTAGAIPTVLEARRRGFIEVGDAPLAIGTVRLSEDQRELLGFMAQGLSDEAVARRLGVSPATVQRRRDRIGEAVGATGSVPIFMATLRLGVLDDDGATSEAYDEVLATDMESELVLEMSPESRRIHGEGSDRATVFANARTAADPAFAAAAGPYVSNLVAQATFDLTRTRNSGYGLDQLRRADEVLAEIRTRMPDEPAIGDASVAISRLHQRLSRLFEAPRSLRHRSARMRALTLEHLGAGAAATTALAQTVELLRRSAAASAPPASSGREREVPELIEAGLGSTEIAAPLRISTGTGDLDDPAGAPPSPQHDGTTHDVDVVGKPGTPWKRPPQLRQVLEKHLADGRPELVTALLRRRLDTEMPRLAVSFGEQAARDIADEVCATAIARFGRLGSPNIEQWLNNIAREVISNHRTTAEPWRRLRAFIAECAQLEHADPLVQVLAAARTTDVRRTLASLPAYRRHRLVRAFWPADPVTSAKATDGTEFDGQALWTAARQLATAVAAIAEFPAALPLSPVAQTTSFVRAEPQAPPARAGAPVGRPTSSPWPTSRELEVVNLIYQGLTYVEIGRRLDVDPKAARNYLRNASEKFGTVGAIQTVMAAKQQGFVQFAGRSPVGFVRFSAEQRELLGLMAEGLTDQAIAGRLGVATLTVKRRRARIGAVLGETKRTPMFMRAVRSGALDESVPARPTPDATPATAALNWPTTQPNSLLYRVQEAELVRRLYDRPEVKSAVVAVLERLETVIRGLCPEAAPEQIRGAFDASARPRWGGMVLPSVPMDELKRDGNLREQMSAVLNAMIRHAELGDAKVGPTLDEGIARYMNQGEEWRRRKADELGLDFHALEAVYAAVLEDKQPGEPITWKDIAPVQYARIHDDIADAAFAEYERRTSAFPARNAGVPRLTPTSGDVAALGMPVSLREFAALPERKVLRIRRLDADATLRYLEDGRLDIFRLTTRLKERDSSVEYVAPTYMLDARGRPIRDEHGQCRIQSVKVYHSEGYVDAEDAYRLDHVERVVQLPWRPGFVYVDPDGGNDYVRELAEQSIPSNAGISGTAARMLARFRWIRSPGISEHDFIAAMITFMLPYHHTMYEFARGLEMIGVRFGDDVNSMYRTVIEQFGPERQPDSPHRTATDTAERRPRPVPWKRPTSRSAEQQAAPQQSVAQHPGNRAAAKSASAGMPAAHIRTCLVQTVRAAWADGLDNARKPPDNAQTWSELTTGLRTSLEEIPVPTNRDNADNDPLAHIIDEILDPTTLTTSAAVVVDDGRGKAHGYYVTRTTDLDGRPQAIIYDTNTPEPDTTDSGNTPATNPHNEPPHIARVRTRDKWTQTYATITRAFVAKFTTATDADAEPTGALKPIPNTPSQGTTSPIQGPPSNDPDDEVARDTGEPVMTFEQADGLRALTFTRGASGVSGAYLIWRLSDPRPEHAGETVIVRRRRAATDEPGPVSIGLDIPGSGNTRDIRNGLTRPEDTTGDGVREPRILHEGHDFVVHEQITGTPVTVFDLVGADMSFLGDVAEQLFAQHALLDEPTSTTTGAAWERDLRRTLRIAEMEIAGRRSEPEMESALGVLGLPALSAVFRPKTPGTGGGLPVGLRIAPILADLVRTPDGTRVRAGWELAHAGPPAWAYAAFAVRNPWPLEVRTQVQDWCRQQLHGDAAIADFDRYLVVEARIAAIRQALQAPHDLVTDSDGHTDPVSTLTDPLSGFTANLAIVYRAATLEPLTEAECARVLDAFANRTAQEWRSELAYVTVELDEPRPPRLGSVVRESPEYRPARHTREVTRALRRRAGTHRLEVTQAVPETVDPGGNVVARVRMHAVVMIDRAEFGDVEVLFDLDTADTVTAYVDPGSAAEFVPAYLAARGGAGRGSFLDMVRHFVRGAGADLLRVKVADDPRGDILHGRELLTQAGFAPAEDAPRWMSGDCVAQRIPSAPVTSRLDRRLTREQVLEVMEQVRVTAPHESENQCGVWHLPLPTVPGSVPGAMVTVRVYLEEAQQLGFDLDSLAVSAAHGSDMFHQAGVRGPRLLFDSESSPTAPDFTTPVTIHEYVPGDKVLPDEGWERTTEDVFVELFRLHSMAHGATSQAYWDSRQMHRIRQLEHSDIDHRMDTLTGGVPLFVTWQPVLADEGDRRMGFTHGNPIRRKMRRGADGRVGFTDAKLAQYAPIAWDWARYYLVNDWTDDTERDEVATEIRTILETRYGDDIGDGLVADFDRYVLLEARKSIVGDAYRLPRKIATGLVTVDEVLPDFYRNVTLVCRAAGRDPMSENDVRELLEEWSRHTLEPDATAAAAPAIETVPAPAAEPRRWIRRLFAAVKRPGARSPNADAVAMLALVQRWDGPRRLEPTRVRWHSSPDAGTVATVTAAVMDGTRMHGEIHFTFTEDASGRMIAYCAGADTSQKTDPLVLEFVRDAGAVHLRTYVSDWPAAARAGFDWNRDHLGEMEMIRETLCDALAALEQHDSAVPAAVAEVSRQLRAGIVPPPGELFDAGIPVDQFAAPWLGCIDLADASTETVWSQPEALLVTAIPVDPAPAPEKLLANIKREGSGTMDSRVAARQFLRAKLRAPDRYGNSKRAWFFRDENGNRIVVLQKFAEEKDLTCNPDPSHRDVRWFRWVPFTAGRAVELAGTVIDVPEQVYRWRDFYVEEFAEGETPEPVDWNGALAKMFEVKRQLLNVRLPAPLRVRSVTEHFHLYLDYQRRNYRRRAPWLDQLFRLAPHQAWSPETDDGIWAPSLSHNDMTLKNVRIAGRTITVIDWDNAAITHPLWDYVTMLWSDWPPEIVEDVENRIRLEVRDLFGTRGEAELERLLTMGCLDSLYGDSRIFVDQIAEDPGKADSLVGRLYSDYERLCRLLRRSAARGQDGHGAGPVVAEWEPESLDVVRTLMMEAVNRLRAERGYDPLLDVPHAVPARPARTSTASVRLILPTAEESGDNELRTVVDGLLDQDYRPDGYTVVPTGARYTTVADNRCLTVSATIVNGSRGFDEVGDMRFHVQRSDNGGVTVTFDHLEIDRAFADGRFTRHFVPRLRDCVAAGGRIIVPVHGPAGVRVAAEHGLRLDTDPDHLAESRESTAHLLSTDPGSVVADPMLARLDRSVEALPTFAELASYLERSPHEWPQGRRWWGVLDGATAEAADARSTADPHPMTRVAPPDSETEHPALTGTDIELLTMLFRNRAHFAGNHHGVWTFVLPNGRKVAVRASLDTPNPNFDPRIGLTVGESAAVQLCRRAGVRVPALYHVGEQGSFPEHFLFHEFLEGEHPTTSDRSWKHIAEAVFPVLDRLHALRAADWSDIEPAQQVPTTRLEWEQRLVREIARIALEFDTGNRLHGELGLPALYDIVDIRAASDNDIPLGLLHGDPTLGNIKFMGPLGHEVGLLDLELAQPGSPVWDYVAFAARNNWPSDTVRDDVKEWCGKRLRRFHGDRAAADFDRYLVLEAWKSVAGDSFRLPLLVARDPDFLEEATESLLRNLEAVFQAVRREAPGKAAVREMLLRWSRQFVQLREQATADHAAGRPASAAEPAARPPATDTSGLPRLSLRELLRTAVAPGNRQAPDTLQQVVATLRRADGPARLEPVAAEYEPPGAAETGVRSRIRLRTVLMDGTREYGEIAVRFDLGADGVTARLDPIGANLERLASDYGAPDLLGPAEDLARRMNADTIELEVSRRDGVRAAHHGYVRIAEPVGRAEPATAVQDTAPRGSGQPAGTPPQVIRSAGPGARFARRWVRKNLADASKPHTPTTFRSAQRRPQGTRYLLDLAESGQDGSLELEDAARMLITVVTNYPKIVGYHQWISCIADASGNPVKVRRVITKPGDKDLVVNPTHPRLLDGDREIRRIELDEDRAEDLARQVGVDIPRTTGRSGDYSFREMGEGRVPATADDTWRQTLHGLLEQLRRLQAVELPAALKVRRLADYEQLYLSMQRIKQEASHPLLRAMKVPRPHEIWTPGDTDETWLGLSHGNATFRNLWVREDDGSVRLLDNWNLAGVRHKLWDYVTIFWNLWPLDRIAEVTEVVGTEIRNLHGESGVREFQRLRAMAALDSLYSDSNYFVRKISLEPGSAGPLTERFYSDYLALWRYAETTGRSRSLGAKLTYPQVRDLLLRAADAYPNRLPPGPDRDTAHATRSTEAASDADLSQVTPVADLLAAPPAEPELLPKLSGLQRQYGELELRLTHAGYLWGGAGDERHISGVRLRGVFVTRGENPAEAGDLDLSIEFDDNDQLIARFDRLWFEPWHESAQCDRQFVSAIRAYLRRSDVDDLILPVDGRRGAVTAIRNNLDWNDSNDPRFLSTRMAALGAHIRADLALRPDTAVDPELRRLLDQLDAPSNGHYPTLTELDRHLPRGMSAADYCDGFHWAGHTAP
ncbi:amidase family protein [Nocardia wallacei]|uniref:amidase family protein n=1 Tax=Nocardia wallacei TaxID=480035 RepID=UPI002454FAC8|nr:amidase family protein [Nocardia wallacei]